MAELQIWMLNSQYIHASPAPWCLKAGVAQYARRPHRVAIVEGTVNESADTLAARLTTDPAPIYGFCCCIWNITVVRRLVRRLRAVRPDAYIIYGGPEASFRVAELLRDDPIDAVICGAGERPLAALLDALDGDRAAIPEIPGVWRCVDGAVRGGAAECARELPEPPDDAAYADALHGRIAYLESSRGCPFSCAFCLSGRNEPVRFRPIAETERRLEELANRGARTIKLIDRTFNCNPARTYELLDFLIRECGRSYPADVRFHFEVAADLFDDRTILRLADAPRGLFQMEAGIQSFHADTLAAVSRKTDTDQLEQRLRTLIGLGNMHIHVDLIAGLPYEDEVRFGESFDRAYALQPQMLQFGFLKLLYGSRLREQAEEYGFTSSPEPPYEIRSTRWLTPDALDRLRRTADALDRIYNSGRFLETAAYLLRATGWTPFRLYTALGARIACTGQSAALDVYTAQLHDAAAALPGVTADALRSAMVRDRLAAVRGGKLPDVLRVPDRRLPAVLHDARRRLGIPADALGVAILYDGEVRVATADYRVPDAISGRYPISEYSLAEFQISY